jgi:hypothetical protein
VIIGGTPVGGAGARCPSCDSGKTAAGVGARAALGAGAGSGYGGESGSCCCWGVGSDKPVAVSGTAPGCGGGGDEDDASGGAVVGVGPVGRSGAVGSAVISGG